jgi:hypothetical protein
LSLCERVGLGVELAAHVLKRDLAALRLQPLDQRARLVGQVLQRWVPALGAVLHEVDDQP